MSNLENKTFKKTKQKTDFEEYYSFFLNELLKVKKEKKITTGLLAKAFNKSKGSISNFETGKVVDFEFMFYYAGFLEHKFTITLDKLNYCEIMAR